MSTCLEEIRNAPTQALQQPKWERIPAALETWLDPAKFAHMQRIAQMFANSDLVPEHFRGNIANCAIALQMAYRMNIDPMMALQNMYVIYGNPGLSSQLCIALANNSGVFDGPIEFVQTGEKDNLIVTARAKMANSRREVSLSVSMKQALEAGWPRDKKGGLKPFWKAMPEQMLRYRSAVFLIRAHCPDVIMGMHTKEEWEDQGDGVEARVDEGASISKRLAAMSHALTPVSAPEPTKEVEKKPTKPEKQTERVAPPPSEKNPPTNTKPSSKNNEQPELTETTNEDDAWEV